MTPEVRNVEPLENFVLLLTFGNGERRVFSVAPYLDKGIFTELCDADYFRTVCAANGFVSWPHDQNFSPDTLYLKSEPYLSRKAG